MPPGSRRGRSQAELLRAFMTDVELGEQRADYAEHLTECWRFLVRLASWADRTTMPVRDRLCKELAISVSTWKRCRRWLERGGWLATVRGGYKPGLMRPSSLTDGEDPNEAAVYVLCIPQKTKPGRPALSHEPLSGPLTGNAPRTDPTHARAREPGQDRGRRLTSAAHFQRQVTELRKGPGHRLSDRHVSAIARPFLTAGWTAADLAFAVAHHPADGRWRYAVSAVGNPGAWLSWRLSHWLGAGGTPRPSPSERAAAAAAADARRRAELLAPAADVQGPPAEARAIFARIRKRGRP